MMNNIEKLIENGGWQPIEEAPKDGVFFVLFNGTYDIARNAEPENGISKRWFWLAINGSVPVDEISHFMPLDTPERMAKVIEHFKMRLAQIASGDYVACQEFAEDVAEAALLEANKIAGGKDE